MYSSQISSLPSDNTYNLPSPINQDHLVTSSNNLPLKISGCVIPGMDFRATQPKICQDEIAFLMHNGCLLCILCDGHGTEGHYISKFATEFVTNYFKKHFSKFRIDPKGITIKMLQKCDKKIIADMECDLSGTTIIVLFIENNIVYSGSLGDSRAILGSLSTIVETACPRYKSRYFRKITCDKLFKTSPLTIDQKPENNDELIRIRQSGGLVEKYTDAFGRNVGPFRV